MQPMGRQWQAMAPTTLVRATASGGGSDGSQNAPAAVAGRDEAKQLQVARSRGDVRTLENLLARHEPGLIALCRGVLGHVEDAEDAVQETFLRALRALPRFREQSGLRTWLFKIALNVCLEHKRGRAAHSAVASLSVLDETVFGGLGQPSPEAGVLRHLRVGAALAALAPRPRAILLLKEWEGWSAPEIARALGCTPRRVYHELDQAHRALADWRKTHDPDENEKGQPL